MNVFISYRREGGYALARLVYECLQKVGIHAFLDLEELRAGPFNEKLYAAIEDCDNFVLILPVGALDRCVNERDWLRLEVEHAILHKKNIIPVMVKGFEFTDNLPPSMQVLPFFNGVQISREYFDASIKKLISMLKNVKPKAASTFVAERDLDVRYYYDEDVAERHRLKTEDLLLTSYEEPIVKKLIDGRKNLVCLDVNVLNTDGSMARLNYPEITKVIALTYNDDITARGNAEKGERDIHFFTTQFEAEDFEEQLENAIEAAGADSIDFVFLSMAIMDFKKPFKVLEAIRDVLNDGAVMLVRDVDDGAVFAYPDKDGYFAKMQSYYVRNKYSGYRYTGRQVYSFIRKMEPASICLERYGINTSEMSRKDKKALFECWFSFIPNDFGRMLREDPSSDIAREVVEFCDKYYDELKEQFFSRETLFNSGYVIYSVRF